MKQTRFIMGMPVTLNIVDKEAKLAHFESVFNYFVAIDEKFSTYKTNSEISKINRGEINEENYSVEMKAVLELCLETKKITNGYFDIKRSGYLDPSGLVKGWAINNVSKLLKNAGIVNFYLDVGGDIQTNGLNSENQPWSVGIKNPFNPLKIVKVISAKENGIATSGNYERGNHIYNPYGKIDTGEVISLTVIANNIFEADRFATAAFAMGRQGINFINSKSNIEGYMIDGSGKGTYTSGFEKFVIHENN